MSYAAILTALFLWCLALRLGFGLKAYADWHEAALTTAICTVFGIVWDSYAWAAGHWTMPPESVHMPGFGWMPLEEYAFVLLLPYALFQVKAGVRRVLARG